MPELCPSVFFLPNEVSGNAELDLGGEKKERERDLTSDTLFHLRVKAVT